MNCPHPTLEVGFTPEMEFVKLKVKEVGWLTCGLGELVGWGLVDWGNSWGIDWRLAQEVRRRGELVHLLDFGYYMHGLNTIHYRTMDQ